MVEFCYICYESLLKGETVVVKRGLDTLRKSSVLRKDGKDVYFRSVNSVKIHIHCRRVYTLKYNILAFLKHEENGTSPIPRPRRNRCYKKLVFNFKGPCFICYKPLLEGETIVEPALDMLKERSIERKDGKDEYLRSVDSVTIHAQCLKEYTQESGILVSRIKSKDGISTSPTQSGMGLSEPAFDFNQLCSICKKPLSEGTSVVKRCLFTMEELSIKLEDEIDERSPSVNSAKIHFHCFNEYTRQSNIMTSKRQREADTSTSPPQRRLCLREPAFNFKELCIFCGKEANEEKEKKLPYKYRHKIHKVSKASVKNTILERTKKRNDEMSKAVERRVIQVHDLVTAEAQYHAKCFNSFLKLRTGGKIGRPKDNLVSLAMEDIYSLIENNNECQFTIKELKDACTDYVPTKNTIKTNILEKYGGTVMVTK